MTAPAASASDHYPDPLYDDPLSPGAQAWLRYPEPCRCDRCAVRWAGGGGCWICGEPTR